MTARRKPRTTKRRTRTPARRRKPTKPIARASLTPTFSPTLPYWIGLTARQCRALARGVVGADLRQAASECYLPDWLRQREGPKL